MSNVSYSTVYFPNNQMNAAFAGTMFPLLLFFYLASCALAGDNLPTNTPKTSPYVTFRGQQLSNHSYINIAQLGNTSQTSLQCHTDSDYDYDYDGSLDFRARWLFPNGGEIQTGGSFTVRVLFQRIELLYSGGSVPVSGIYRCQMPTVSANGTTNQSVYIGLYTDTDGRRFRNCKLLTAYKSFTFMQQVL